MALQLTSQAAIAMETPYRYSPAAGQCTNSQGVVGMRAGFKGVCGDLWGADLKGADLAGLDLSGANLSRAQLKGANLKGANLSGATMLLTQVEGAILEGALFNDRTVLPFSRADAEKRGMIFQPAGAKVQR